MTTLRAETCPAIDRLDHKVYHATDDELMTRGLPHDIAEHIGYR